MSGQLGLCLRDWTTPSAAFSNCGRYRYQLTRDWGGCPLNWLMLNPSTADALEDDPTIRRCIGFARRWGYGGIVVTNLFAWRATDPRELLAADDPVGPVNDTWIRESAELAGGDVLCAWGSRGDLLGRAAAVLRLLDGGCQIRCLGTTKDGHPRHPLYVRGDTEPVPFPTLTDTEAA